jgi:hypothetical protein
MTPPVRVYCCARCGLQFKKGEERLHSEWSGNSYCINVDACARRARRFTGRVPIVWRAPVYR